MMASSSSLMNFRANFLSSKDNKDASNKRYIIVIFTSGALVFVLTLCIFVIVSILSGGIDPVILGFFCNDHSIRYPFKHRATLPTWSLYITGVLVPIFVLTCGTLLDIKRICTSGNNTTSTPFKRQINYHYFVKPLLWFFWYLIGIGITNIITDVIKLSFGELRPYFLSVCNPDMSLINCTDEFGWPVYVTNYSCRGDPAEIREARLSFPSGHASTSSFMFVFIALYISSLRIIHSRSPLQFLFIALIGILLTMFVSVTRITDFRHHFRDVIVGTILGTLIAFLVVYFHTYYFGHYYCSCADTNCTAATTTTTNKGSCTKLKCGQKDTREGEDDKNIKSDSDEENTQ